MYICVHTYICMFVGGKCTCVMNIWYINTYVHMNVHKCIHTEYLNMHIYVFIQTNVWSKNTRTCVSKTHAHARSTNGRKTKRYISTPPHIRSASLAASGYACSSNATTSGPAWFATARCSGSVPPWSVCVCERERKRVCVFWCEYVCVCVTRTCLHEAHPNKRTNTPIAVPS